MGRKAKKTKTERAQELQAALEPTDAQIEQAAAEAEAIKAEAEATEAEATEAPVAEAEASEPEAEASEPEAEEEKVPASIVPRKYRTEYKARGHARRCGDDLSAKMEGWVQDQDGNLVLDHVYAIAKANGVTKEWRHLNPGQQRMNAGNMLRNILKNGDGILIVPASVTKGEDAKVAISPYAEAAAKDAA